MKATMVRTVFALCILLIALPSAAQITEERKIEVNKIIHMIGFVPNVNAGAATGETEPNDSCAAADPADPFADDITGAIDVGGDVDIYLFQANAGDCVTFGTDSFNGSSTDTQLRIYDTADCSTSLAFDDDGGPGLFSLISEFPIPAAGTYAVEVVHFSASGTGEYMLSSSTAACPAPPANDTCSSAIALNCGDTVSGTTENGTNDMEDLAEVCVPFGADGPDAFYSVVVDPGFQLTALVNPTDPAFDPALWFVKVCGDESSCVAGSDSGFAGDPETATWTNNEAGPVTIYVIADSFQLAEEGPFDLTVTCDQVVANEDTSFGAVKAQY